MPLSRDWSLARFHHEATKDIRGFNLVQNDRIDLIHRVVSGVAAQFYALFGQAYMTSLLISSSGGIASIAASRLMRGFEHKIVLESASGASPVGEVVGSQAFVAGDNNVTFGTALTSASYLVFPRCVDGSGATIAFNQNIVKTTAGFTVPDVLASATFDYLVHELGQGTASASVSLLAGSNNITFPVVVSGGSYVPLIRCFDSSGSTVSYAVSNMQAGGFTISVIDACTCEYYALSLAATFPVGLIKNAGRVSVGSGASQAVTLATVMGVSTYAILLPDLYNTAYDHLAFSISAKTTSGFTVNNAIAEAGTFDYIAADLAQSTVTSAAVVRLVDPLSVEALRAFRSTAFSNKYRVVYAYNGEEFFVRWGYGLTSVGTLTCRYPRVPEKATTDSTLLDLPDGLAMNLALLAYRTQMKLRATGEMNGYADEGVAMARALYESFGMSPKTEEITQKVQALL